MDARRLPAEPPAASSLATTRIGASPAPARPMSSIDQCSSRRRPPPERGHAVVARLHRDQSRSHLADRRRRASPSFADATRPSPVILLAAEATTGPGDGPARVEHGDPNRPRHHVALPAPPARPRRDSRIRRSARAGSRASCTVRVPAKPWHAGSHRTWLATLSRPVATIGDVERLIVIVDPGDRQRLRRRARRIEQPGERRDAVLSRAGPKHRRIGRRRRPGR